MCLHCVRVSSSQSALTMTPLLCLLLAASLPAALASTPVVLWHGMGDSAAGMIGIAVSNRAGNELSRN